MCRNGYNKVLCIEIGMGCFRALGGPLGWQPGRWVWRVKGVGRVKGRGEEEGLLPRARMWAEARSNKDLHEFLIGWGWHAGREEWVNQQEGPVYNQVVSRRSQGPCRVCSLSAPCPNQCLLINTCQVLWPYPRCKRRVFFKMEQHGYILFFIWRSPDRKGFHQN